MSSAFPDAVADIPTPPHVHLDSMLSRKFGKETVNYFSGSLLNRVSFLRTDGAFLSAALRHPTTRFLLFNDLNPLVRSPSEIFYASYNDVKTLIHEDVFDKTEADALKDFQPSITTPLLIFLGLDETQKENSLSYKSYTGAPFFALDVTPRGTIEQPAKGIIATMEANGLSFFRGRTVTTLPADVAAIYAQARALLDWNTRNAYCGTCGHLTMSIQAGTKRACPPHDTKGPRPPCSTRTSISNLSFPRTDPTIIVAVVSHDGQRVLLGRQKRYPPHWYSTLAGFIEPAESVEDAVRREVWEESGVVVSRVVIHSTQPWPYPANLMIGAIAQVARPEHEVISLQHDPELEDARWFSIAEAEEALKLGTSDLEGKPGPGYREGALRLPPRTAIAHQLIAAVIHGGF
ncbi:peroxisomal NADH pyrophosphatase NUDT12 [Histoplasma capsulatum G186AR]|uniref:NAD(+) diphosphatase n=1 Tax=Ajellomyces capsulatus TaxID=5037 RepID=A0A8H7Z9L0_AJECA|nr:peroxisomal NADH pyrophosphatase NUDT12 [Histoplasma capsulatum]QSS76247.1 peroxisomal NADH pyrophosphatase NUDT12 [Histoplasma capsulatum G186AR]